MAHHIHGVLTGNPLLGGLGRSGRRRRCRGHGSGRGERSGSLLALSILALGILTLEVLTLSGGLLGGRNLLALGC